MGATSGPPRSSHGLHPLRGRGAVDPQQAAGELLPARPAPARGRRRSPARRCAAPAATSGITAWVERPPAHRRVGRRHRRDRRGGAGCPGRRRGRARARPRCGRGHMASAANPVTPCARSATSVSVAPGAGRGIADRRPLRVEDLQRLRLCPGVGPHRHPDHSRFPSVDPATRPRVAAGSASDVVPAVGAQPPQPGADRERQGGERADVADEQRAVRLDRHAAGTDQTLGQHGRAPVSAGSTTGPWVTSALTSTDRRPHGVVVSSRAAVVHRDPRAHLAHRVQLEVLGQPALLPAAPVDAGDPGVTCRRWYSSHSGWSCRVGKSSATQEASQGRNSGVTSTGRKPMHRGDLVGQAGRDVGTPSGRPVSDLLEDPQQAAEGELASSGLVPPRTGGRYAR